MKMEFFLEEISHGRSTVELFDLDKNKFVGGRGLEFNSSVI